MSTQRNLSPSEVHPTTGVPRSPVFLTAAWRWLAIANYVVPPELLAPYLPRGTELDLFAGQAFVSFVGFRFLNTRVLGWSLPGHRDFDELNLRFYVYRTTSNGEVRRGVVFIKEIVARPLVSLVARAVYNESYTTLPMRHSISTEPSPVASYDFRFAGRWQQLAVQAQAGASHTPITGSIEEFIVEHYWGYTRRRDGTTSEYQVAHPAWRVWPAARVELDIDVTAIYGPAFGRFVTGVPHSALLAEGSEVCVTAGQRLTQ